MILERGGNIRGFPPILYHHDKSGSAAGNDHNLGHRVVDLSRPLIIQAVKGGNELLISMYLLVHIQHVLKLADTAHACAENQEAGIYSATVHLEDEYRALQSIVPSGFLGDIKMHFPPAV